MDYTAKKTVCPVSRQQFDANAKAVKVSITSIGADGKPVIMDFEGSPRQLNTGSMGWNVNSKLGVLVDGLIVQCQLGVNLTAIGSKELPTVESPAAPATVTA